jgi:hypothetical protein
MNNSLVLRCDYGSLAVNGSETADIYVFTIENDHAISSSFSVTETQLRQMLDFLLAPSFNNYYRNLEKFVDVENFKLLSLSFYKNEKVFIRIEYNNKFNNLDMLFEFSPETLSEFVSYLRASYLSRSV